MAPPPSNNNASCETSCTRGPDAISEIGRGCFNKMGTGTWRKNDNFTLQRGLFGGVRQRGLAAELARFESHELLGVVHLGEQSVRYKIHLGRFAETRSGEILG